MTCIVPALALAFFYAPVGRTDDATAEAFAAARQQIEFAQSLSCEGTIKVEGRDGPRELKISYHRDGTKEVMVRTDRGERLTRIRLAERDYSLLGSVLSIAAYDTQMRATDLYDPWTLIGFRKLEELIERYQQFGINDPFRKYEKVATTNPHGSQITAALNFEIARGGRIRREYTFDRSKGGLCILYTVLWTPPDQVQREICQLEDVRQAQPGLYLPYRVIYTYTDEKNNKNDQRIVLTVKSMAVNGKLPTDAFKVPYRRGIRVWDHIRGVEYDCDDKGDPISPVIPIRKPALRPVPPPKP